MIRLALALLLLAAPGTIKLAWAAESAAVRSPRLTATLISEFDAVTPGQPTRLALRLRMAPGWHTYWRNPGDAGAPPELTLEGAGPFQWPMPARQPEGPVMTYGYSGEVVLPFALTPTGQLHAVAEATWLVCERICVPEHGRFTLDLPTGPATPSPEATLFAAADARMPRPSPFAARIADGVLTLSGEGLSPATVHDAWFIPGMADAIENPAPQRVRVRDGRVEIGLTGTTPGPLAGIVALRDPGGQETYLQIDAQPGAPGPGLWQALGLALLGGLVLNLMPCVFPVLAMKAMAVARLSGQARGAVRAEAGFYTLGVLTAFGALGAVMLAVRGAGWGFQFQSPVFVAVMAWVLFGVGLNLSGVFEVRWGAAGAGQGLASRGGHAGSFFTGLLAVLVATPCTAPFMGAAIAAALAAPPLVAMAVFLALGLGLAAPYVALALVPGMARALPRPGVWMDVLRGALAFPMYGAAAWLVWVIGLQAAADGVLAVVGGAVLLGLAAWSWGLGQRLGGRLGPAVALVAVLAMAGTLTLITPGAPVAQAEGTEPFTAARLATLRAEGRPVFVNMTAAWCVTCLVNERVALAPAAIRAAFAARGIVYLKGDWTRQDAEITAYLRSQARDGVPLYVYYPPGRAGAVLPQVLTAQAVLDALGA